MPKTMKAKYPEVTDIKQDLESLKDNTVELAQHVKQDTAAQLEETVQTVKSRTQDEFKKLEKQVQAKPMQSVALALAGGLVAGMLLRGRR